ncbi:glutaredoxin domain-containing cysteine-rich protein CG31559-like [Phymastichus coffea]|uniref:glutaredoxin domain-containing cysteine-rich protein CG31559-like n=1 Tax=Phymastichus coffea TaxID=108790 RepID=UPI00273AFB43|nr:glutaredoxin domain-containing cysteine-rich protein CG31559-like [Phymastichus coffea]
MDALVRMSGGAPSTLGLQGLARPEHSQIISIRSPSSVGLASNGINAGPRPPPHALAAAGTVSPVNGCSSGAGATVYIGPSRLPEAPAPSAPAQRHVVKIKIQPSCEPAAKLVSAVRLSLEDDQDGDAPEEELAADSCLRISVGGSLYSGSESSSEEMHHQQQAEPREQSCFFYSSPPGSMLIASGQCSPSETLDSGTCSDLDGTPPPLPKKKAPGTLLLEADQASLADADPRSKSTCGPILQQQRGQQQQQQQEQQQSARHNRTGSLTSSGAELDSSDDNESSISCDSLNSAELPLGLRASRSLELHQDDDKPLVSECTYEERRRELRHEQQQQQQQQAVQRPRYLYEDDRHYKFHVNEREEVSKAELAASAARSNDGTGNSDDECFAGYKNLKREAIRSARGTVRGVKNRVRAGIATFLENPATKNYKAKDAGKVVVYTTTMAIVRETYYRCVMVKQILRTHMVKYEERDMYMSSELQTELKERLGCEAIQVPQLFIDGQYIGNADKVERLNETGELRLMLKPYRSLNACNTCQVCGGYRLLPCPICNGSKKSLHRNDFTTEFIALKCMNCDEGGLVRCQHC